MSNSISGKSNQAMPADTVMANVNRSAKATSDELRQACGRLESLRTRLFGQVPQPVSTDGLSTGPQSVMEELHQEFDIHQQLVNRLTSVITELERLA